MAAFILAVTTSFGSDQACRAAQDWLEELALIDAPSIRTTLWRNVTIAAAVRLADRVKLEAEADPVGPTPARDRLATVTVGNMATRFPYD